MARTRRQGRTRSRLNGLRRGPGGVIVRAGEGIVGAMDDIGLRGCRPHAEGMLLDRVGALMVLARVSSACLNPDSIPALAGGREVPRLLLPKMMSAYENLASGGWTPTPTVADVLRASRPPGRRLAAVGTARPPAGRGQCRPGAVRVQGARSTHA